MTTRKLSQMQGWINIYPWELPRGARKTWDVLYLTRAEADKYAQPDRVVCIKMTGEYEEEVSYIDTVVAAAIKALPAAKPQAKLRLCEWKKLR